MGVPFLPVRSLLGTDTFRHGAACAITCPFTGERLAAIPALYPDVAAIHVHEADRTGNCRIVGTTVADLDLARAAKRLIITCERLVTEDEIRREPTRTVIPFFLVDAVCEVPCGSYPGNMPGEYFSDEAHLRAWLEVECAYTEGIEHRLEATVRGEQFHGVSEPVRRDGTPRGIEGVAFLLLTGALEGEIVMPLLDHFREPIKSRLKRELKLYLHKNDLVEQSR